MSPAFGWDLPYASRRQPVLADGVVATSQPLAVQAGMTILERGGNAVDAAVAAAMALTVVEPTSNGIGGDAFAIVSDGRRLHGLNASGRSPAHIDSDRLRELDGMPLRGWDAVTVPGAVSGWVALVERFGSLDLEALAGPAIRLATDGFPVSPMTSSAWRSAEEAFADRDDFAAAFLRDGRAPRPGERVVLADHAATLAAIASSAGTAFYEGELAGRIAEHARTQGGTLDEEDLANHEPEWVQPLGVPYGDVTVHELPPNGQGVAALQAFGLVSRTGHEHLPVDTAQRLHVEIEAMKLALADAHRHVADPDAMTVRVEDLIASGYLDERADRIDADRARDPRPGAPRPGGTVYLATGDADGRAVSFIQSNYYGFGSGVVVPGTGIALQNRGAGFVTEAGHPNVVAPRKRPYHTIIPGFVTDADGPVAAFGVMGGPMQPQGHLQVVGRILAGENPQAAIDAPRWRVEAGRAVTVEPGFADRTLAELAAAGHDLRLGESGGFGGFGGAQLAWRLDRGGWLAASDPRKDGHAAGR